MKKLNFVSITAMSTLLALGAPGCLDEAEPATLNTVQAQGPRGAMGETQLRFRAAAFSPRVYAIEYTITNNASGEVIVRTVDVNHNMTIPGGIPELGNRPLDPNSKHNFTDFFVSVDPGSYKVSIRPIGYQGGSLEGECFGGSRDSVIARAGDTTELFLMVQCASQTAGALDILAAINHAPSITSMTYTNLESGNPDEGSPKYVCGDTLGFCVSARDIDNDPLSFFVDAPADCDVFPGPAPQYPPSQEGGELSQCFELSCPRGTEGRRIEFTVNALDMAYRAGELVSMESVLRDRGLTQLSRAVMNGIGNFLSEEACTTDPDCRPTLPPRSRDLVILQDATQSMVKERLQIRGKLESLMATLNELQPSQVDECPSVPRFSTRAALVSFADKPFSIFGATSDWVYREEQSATSDAQALVLAHSNIGDAVGAGAGEAQIEALMAAAQNMSRLGFSATSSSSTQPRYAVVLTNSDFLEQDDCPWDESAPVCQFANNHDGIVDPTESYPTVAMVHAELADAGVHPIFVIVESPDVNSDKIGNRYQNEFLLKPNLTTDKVPGAVTYWDPSAGPDLDQVVLSAIRRINDQLGIPN